MLQPSCEHSIERSLFLLGRLGCNPLDHGEDCHHGQAGPPDGGGEWLQEHVAAALSLGQVREAYPDKERLVKKERFFVNLELSGTT